MEEPPLLVFPLVDGLDVAEQRGDWRPDARSEARRRTLLPVGPAPAWDALQHEPRYRQAQAVLAAGPPSPR